MKPLASFSTVAVLVAAMCVARADAAPQNQDAVRGIRVTGVGEVTAKPDTVVIRGEFSANADTAADALTKYRDGRRRALKMMESLGLETMTVTGNGPIITVAPVMNDRNAMRAAMMGFENGQPEPDGKVQVREVLSIRVTNLSDTDAATDLVAKVLDKAKEAGIRVWSQDAVPQYYRAAFGWSAEEAKESSVAIAYSVTDRAKLEEAACAAAMEDARKRAEMLARLVGRKAGPAISIRHEGSATEKSAFDATFRVTLHVVFDFAQ